MLKALNLLPSYWIGEAKAFLKDHCDAVVLTCPQWKSVMPAPGVWDEAQFIQVDGQLADARRMGLRVLMVVDSCSYPQWMCNVHGEPADLRLDGPWARALVRMLGRYRQTLPIVLNEPEFAFRSDVPGRALWVASMMKAAATIAHSEGIEHVLMPATATDWMARAVLDCLHGWKPAVKVGWAHHQYADVTGYAGQPHECRSVLDALEHANWHSGRFIWLTEGGYHYSTHQTPGAPNGWDPQYWAYSSLPVGEQAQLDGVTRNVQWAKRSGHVGCWANYEYTDSLWAGWASGLKAHDGTSHPILERWKTL